VGHDQGREHRREVSLPRAAGQLAAKLASSVLDSTNPGLGIALAARNLPADPYVFAEN